MTLVLGVWLLDLIVPAYDPGTHTTYAGSPFTHIGHMLSYAERLKAVPNATGISSTPWQWLLNEKPIPYSRVAVNSLSGGKIVASRAVFDARGEINPFIIFLAIPALFAAIAGAWHERDTLAAIGVAWCVGTFVPLAVQAHDSGPHFIPLLHADRAARHLPNRRPDVLAVTDSSGGDDRLGRRARL